MKKNISIFWHRRDLRITDNAGLYHALKNEKTVQPVFIFDRNILDELPDKSDARVEFIQQALTQLNNSYQELGTSLMVFYGKPLEVYQKLHETYHIKAVYTNRDYEPYAHERDRAVYAFFKEKDIPFKGYKDHVIFEKNEVMKNDGTPYTVFTPYSRKWKEKLNDFYAAAYPVEKYLHHLNPVKKQPVPALSEIGFKHSGIPFPDQNPDILLIRKYGTQRDIPGIRSTSRLGIHLRFGTISIRELLRLALEESEVFVNELIWRDFYQMILFHFPHTVSGAFKPAYDKIPWRNNQKEFTAWCQGLTGYPLVDAGMRELNATGFMHNRVRMVVASFLTKHLLIDWRWGEAYFAEKLLDFELASNIGGWQWAAGCGCDAAPYFRVFNPALQMQKFDADLRYIKQWVPEYGTSKYPAPIVEHGFARDRIIGVFKKALNDK